MVTPTGSVCARKLNAFIKGKVNSNELNLPVVAEFLHKLRLGFFDGELLTVHTIPTRIGTKHHLCSSVLVRCWLAPDNMLSATSLLIP